MTFTEAAVEVLRHIGRPLHYKKITELAIQQNMLSHVGKTPEITMSSRLATMVRKDRGEAPIVKVKPGVFALREFSAEVMALADAEQSFEPDMSAWNDENARATESAVTDSAADTPAASLPGSDLFPEEEGDDEPIFAAGQSQPPRAKETKEAKEAKEGRDEDGNGRRRRRRRRRRPGAGDEVELGASELTSARGCDDDDALDGLADALDHGPQAGSLVGKDLADAIEVVLEAQVNRAPVPATKLAEQLVRRGRLQGEVNALLPTVWAAVRGDNARRHVRGERGRFQWQQDRLALRAWMQPADAARVERDMVRLARRYSEVVRRAFLRRLADLPVSAMLEVVATWLNAEGVSGLRAVRREDSRIPGAFHLAGLRREHGASTTLAIVVVPAASVEAAHVIEVRGALHHYGDASAAWILALAPAADGAPSEAAAAGQAPCRLLAGTDLAAAFEQLSIGLRSRAFHVAEIDVDFLASLAPAGRPGRSRDRDRDRDRDRGRRRSRRERDAERSSERAARTPRSTSEASSAPDREPSAAAPTAQEAETAAAEPAAGLRPSAPTLVEPAPERHVEASAPLAELVRPEEGESPQVPVDEGVEASAPAAAQ